VSCAIGNAVLDIIEDEKLLEHASLIGSSLLTRLNQLKEKHSIIGDVRGVGLFVGVDLVKDRASREPATAEAQHVLTRLKQKRILLQADGPNRNVLKFKPPMVFSQEDVDRVITELDLIFGEIEEAK